MAQTGTIITNDALPLEPIVALIACKRLIIVEDRHPGTPCTGFVLHMPHADDPGFFVLDEPFEIRCSDNGCLQGEILGYVEAHQGTITLHTYMD